MQRYEEILIPRNIFLSCNIEKKEKARKLLQAFSVNRYCTVIQQNKHKHTDHSLPMSATSLNLP